MTSRIGIPVILLVGLAAATLSYLGHHTPSLDGHAVWNAFLVIAGSAAAAAAVSAFTRRPPAADIVIARPSALSARVMEPGDIHHVARLHAEALPHGFLVSLGQTFLQSYDRTFAESPHAVAFVADVDGYPVGFLLGVLQPDAHARFLRRRRGGRLALLGLLALAWHPSATKRFIRTRVGRYVRAWRSKGEPRPRPSSAPAVLSHVAVEPGARGAGAGRLLVERFIDAAREAGADEARLLTVADDDGSSAFYRRLGWRLVDHRPDDASGPSMDEFALELRSR